MAWIEVHQQLVSHPKILDVADDLEICAPQAIGHLLCLWMWALEYAEDGDLSRFSVRRIEGAAQWPGEPGALVEALQRRGWLDEWLIHDWWEYAGKLVERRRSDALRKAEARGGRRAEEGGQAPGKPGGTEDGGRQAAASPAAQETTEVVTAEVAAGADSVSGGRPADIRGTSVGRPADVLRNPTPPHHTKPNRRSQYKTRDKPPPPPPDAPEVGRDGVVVVAAFDRIGILSPEARERAAAGWHAVHGEALRPVDVLAWGKYLEDQNKGKRNGNVLGPGLVVTALEAGRRAPAGCYEGLDEDAERMRYVVE